MADDDTKDTGEYAETTSDAPEESSAPQGAEGAEEAQAQADAAADEEAPAEPEPEPEAQADAGAGDTAEAEAEPEAHAETEVAGDADADGAAEASPAVAPAVEDQGEPLSPKERRRLARSKHVEARPQRSAEERQSERGAERAAKAARRRARRLQERGKAKERAAERGPAAELAPVHPPREGTRRVRQGVVISDKASKTITVRIDVARRHRRYEKIVRSSTTLHAHDEADDAREGDVVRVVESRPLSRTKRWRLLDVVERAQ